MYVLHENNRLMTNSSQIYDDLVMDNLVFTYMLMYYVFIFEI